MKTSFAPRAASLIASILLTFVAVKSIAEYAYPEVTPVQAACSARCNLLSVEPGQHRGI